jgi:S-adenosyl-l-methionine hydroxide adenosyltransferase
MRVVTLLSDFGTRDGYVAQMKGTILDSCPNALVTDISLDVERHNIPMVLSIHPKHLKRFWVHSPCHSYLRLTRPRVSHPSAEEPEVTKVP